MGNVNLRVDKTTYSVDEDHLRSFLVLRALKAAVAHGGLDPLAVEYCLKTDELQAAFDVLADDFDFCNDEGGAQVTAFKAMNEWVKAIHEELL